MWHMRPRGYKKGGGGVQGPCSLFKILGIQTQKLKFYWYVFQLFGAK